MNTNGNVSVNANVSASGGLLAGRCGAGGGGDGGDGKDRPGFGRSHSEEVYYCSQIEKQTSGSSNLTVLLLLLVYH